MLRITGGAWRGRVLRDAAGPDVRPTSARVREALFSMVGQDLTGWTVLDLCGGSGLIAFEALSRGASVATVVERDARAYAHIRENAFQLGAELSVIRGDARRIRLPLADFVYLDPPYKDRIEDWLEIAAPLSRRVLVAEARQRSGWPEVAGLTLDRVRTQGEGTLAVYRRPSDKEVGARAVELETTVVLDDGGMVEHDG